MPYTKNQKFYKEIFHVSEIDYCLQFKDPAPHFAGKFAIKESVIKAIKENLSFIDIELSYISSKPTITIHKRKIRYKFHASVSHEKNFAIAIVIAEKK